MSKLAPFDDLLQQYNAFEYHHDATLKQRLHDAQDWLKQRIKHTHQDYFNQPENQLMAQYFLNRLYGGPDFDSLALQIERLLKYAHKAENLIPDNAIKTGTKSVGLAILSMQLDQQIAIQLLKDYPAEAPITDEMMRQTLIKLDQKEQRLTQLQALDDLGEALDKYMRSLMMYAAFKMCKSAAHKYNFDLMYEFIQEGFMAMKPLKSAEQFIRTFSAVERDIIEKVHSDHPDPFR
ncbi:FFLEELY motif protein [Acinetobacter ihumii]|uniref:FFLEELY motif protein n=1 Tax=Acinetobacter ihumii TaxID=2483802 RepID=UPI00102F71D4|nr:hypothetical protein [Acinetobacter ihumii]